MRRFDSWKLLKIIGYPLVFLVAFVLFLLWTFPVERFVGVAEQQLGAILGRHVKIADIDMSPFGAVVLSGVEIEVPPPEEDTRSSSRFSMEDDEAEEEAKAPKDSPKLTYVFDEIVIDLGVLSLIGGGLDVTVETDAFGGELELSYSGPLPSKKKGDGRRRRVRRPGRNQAGPASAEEGDDEEEDNDEGRPLDIHISAEGLELRQIHDLRRMMPLPITGTLGMEADLSSATGKLADLSGNAEMEIKGLVLSRKDYKAEMFGMQMQVPPLAISSADFVMKFKEGKGKVEKLDVKSKHLALEVAGDIELADPFERSRVDLYVMFKVLEGYLASSDAVRTIMSQADMFSSDMRRAHRDDGFYGFRYRGIWKTARMRPSKQGPETGRGNTSSRSRRSTSTRPTRRPTPSIPSRGTRPVPPSMGSPTRQGINVPSVPSPRPSRSFVDTEAAEPRPTPRQVRDPEPEEEMVFDETPPEEEVQPEDDNPPRDMHDEDESSAEEFEEENPDEEMD